MKPWRVWQWIRLLWPKFLYHNGSLRRNLSLHLNLLLLTHSNSACR